MLPNATNADQSLNLMLRRDRSNMNKSEDYCPKNVDKAMFFRYYNHILLI